MVASNRWANSMAKQSANEIRRRRAFIDPAACQTGEEGSDLRSPPSCQVGYFQRGFLPVCCPFKLVKDLAEIERVRVNLRLGAEQNSGCRIRAGLIAKDRDHRARVENKDQGRDSRARSSLFRLMNDSLNVVTCQYLPLIDWTSSRRPVESDGRHDPVANASISSLRCSAVSLRTTSRID